MTSRATSNLPLKYSLIATFPLIHARLSLARSSAVAVVVSCSVPFYHNGGGGTYGVNNNQPKERREGNE